MIIIVKLYLSILLAPRQYVSSHDRLYTHVYTRSGNALLTKLDSQKKCEVSLDQLEINKPSIVGFSE